MAAHSSITAWRTPWTEEEMFMGLQRVGHFHTFKKETAGS